MKIYDYRYQERPSSRIGMYRWRRRGRGPSLFSVFGLGREEGAAAHGGVPPRVFLSSLLVPPPSFPLPPRLPCRPDVPYPLCFLPLPDQKVAPRQLGRHRAIAAAASSQAQAPSTANLRCPSQNLGVLLLAGAAKPSYVGRRRQPVHHNNFGRQPSPLGEGGTPTTPN